MAGYFERSETIRTAHVYQVPSTLPYLHQYAVDMAYVTPYSMDETRKHFKRRTYAVLLRMAEAALGPSEPRIVRKHREIIGNAYGLTFTHQG